MTNILNKREAGLITIGYSGHAYVANNIALSMGLHFVAYCDNEEKKSNPFNLKYWGHESAQTAQSAFAQHDFFISIGTNAIRRNIFVSLSQSNYFPINLIHSNSYVDPSATIGQAGIMIATNAVIHPLATIGNGVICNTGSIIEHECVVGAFSHISPGAVLCGNVSIGENTHVGANSVIREGIRVGSGCLIGAGSVVVKDVPDNTRVLGNPARVV